MQTHLEKLESLDLDRLELEFNEAKFAGLASEELGGNHQDIEVVGLTGPWESIFNILQNASCGLEGLA